MRNSDFRKRLTTLNRVMTVNDAPMERVDNWMGTIIPNVFTYAITSEKCQERNLAEVGKEREFTFMHDLSIGEWVSGRKGVLDTVKNVLKSWKDDEKAMAEFVLSVNWKSWEHNARKNTQWAIFYSELYEDVRDLVYDYFEGNDEKVFYLYHYLD